MKVLHLQTKLYSTLSSSIVSSSSGEERERDIPFAFFNSAYSGIRLLF